MVCCLLPGQRAQGQWLCVLWSLCSELVFAGDADIHFLAVSGVRNDPLVGLMPLSGVSAKTPRANAAGVQVIVGLGGSRSA